MNRYAHATIRKSARLISFYLLLVIFFIIFITGCYFSAAPHADIIRGDVDIADDEVISDNRALTGEEVIRGYFDMSEEELLKSLGPDYEIVATGAEGAMDGYYYKDLGLVFTFYNGELDFIDGVDGFDIRSAHPGMDFAQIWDLLGPADITDTWVELPDYAAYEIEYAIGGCRYVFLSYEPDGADSMLTIFK